MLQQTAVQAIVMEIIMIALFANIKQIVPSKTQHTFLDLSDNQLEVTGMVQLGR